MVLLDSIYINNSGGKVLLDILIKNLFESGEDVFYLLDSRCLGSYSFLPENNVLYLKATMLNRYKFYKENKSRFTKILCFGNIPPPIKTKAIVYTYFHNVLFFELPPLYPKKDALSFKLKYFILKILKRNSDYFIVQTDVVKNMAIKSLGLSEDKIKVIPFFKELKQAKQKSKDKFCYIGIGHPHKNHINLLKAWEIIHKRGYNFELNLTIDGTYPELLNIVEKYKSKGINIINHYYKNSEEIFIECAFQVYPSLCESFGLTLIEATMAGCETIASNLPYVNAVITPMAKFDPLNPASIADTVIKCYLTKGYEQETILLVKNQIEDLVNTLLKK